MPEIRKYGDKRLACNNFRKDRKCPDCGKIIEYPWTRCYPCHMKAKEEGVYDK